MGNEKDISILMVIGQFYPLVGGAEKTCQKLSRELIEKEVSVTVLTQHCDGLPEYEEIDGIPVYRKMKRWHPYGISYMLTMLSFLIKHRNEFDIIQCFGLFVFVPPVLLIKAFFGKRAVVRLLCSGHYGDFQGIKQLKIRSLITASSKRFDRIIFISNDIHKELIDNKFPPEKLHYIPNCVDTNKFRPLEKQDGYNVKNICFVGRLDAQKGLEDLIKAMDGIRSKENEVRLYIVGEGNQKDALEGLCKRLKLKDHVIFAGVTDNVLQYYHRANIFVLPSLSEGMSSSLLEAMSCGLPVIATSVGGNTDVLGPTAEAEKTIETNYHIGEYGILVKPGDVASLKEAIITLLHDRSLSKRLGENARKCVENKFSQEKIVNEYIKLYYDIAE